MSGTFPGLVATATAASPKLNFTFSDYQRFPARSLHPILLWACDLVTFISQSIAPYTDKIVRHCSQARGVGWKCQAHEGMGKWRQRFKLDLWVRSLRVGAVLKGLGRGKIGTCLPYTAFLIWMITLRAPSLKSLPAITCRTFTSSQWLAVLHHWRGREASGRLKRVGSHFVYFFWCLKSRTVLIYRQM